MTKEEIFTKHFDHVAIEASPTLLSKTIGHDSLSIHQIWKGVDRADVGGYSVRNTAADRKLAERLAAAMADPKNYEKVELKTDVAGHTYIDAWLPVLGRHMNADLKKLGY